MKAIERAEKLAGEVFGPGVAVSVDAEAVAARPILREGRGFVARVWSATGKCLEYGAGITRSEAVAALVSTLKQAKEIG